MGKFLVLFAIAIPWYWGWFPVLGVRPVLGMPMWFVISIAGSLVISFLAAWKFNQPWPDELPPGVEEPNRPLSNRHPTDGPPATGAGSVDGSGGF